MHIVVIINFICWFLITMAITKILTESKISVPFKRLFMAKKEWNGTTVYSHTIFSEFLNCDICSGFWISIGTGLWLRPHISFYMTNVYLPLLIETVFISLLFIGALMFYKNVVERG